MPGSSDKKPDAFDRVSSYVFYGIEFVILVFVGYQSSNSLSKRVFYERSKKWAKSKSICFLPADFQKVMDTVVHSRNFAELEELTKFGKLGNQQTKYVELVIEYCKDTLEEPVYLTVKGMGLKQLARQAGIKGQGILENIYVKQLQLQGDTIYELDRVLPGLKLLPDTIHTQAIPAANNLSEADFSIPPQTPLGTPAKAGKAEKMDFRQAAVQESMDLLGINDSTYPQNENISACLQIVPEDSVSVKKNALLPILFFILGIFCLPGGLLIAILGSEVYKPGTEEISAMGYVVIAAGICVFLSSFLLFRRSSLFNTRRMKKILLTRPGALFEAHSHSKIFTSNIENSNTYNVFKLAPDDLGLVCLDLERRRLLIEGCTHRYIIYGEDILQLEPLQSQNENVIHLCYLIGDRKLGITLSVESLKKAFLTQTIFGLFKGRSSQKFADELKEALGVPELIEPLA